MTKIRGWPVRAMYMLIAAALVISLIIVAVPAQKVAADPGLSEWDEVYTPTTSGWVLAPQSVIIDYALASAGEVAYAVVNNTTDYLLLKSDDHAATWAGITDVLEDVDDSCDIQELVSVATNGVDPDFVAVALREDGEIRVYFSPDGGDTFEDAGEVEDGAFFDSADDVANLAVSYEAGGKREVAIGGEDDSGEAALFRSTVTGDSATAWEDATAYDGWDDDGDFISILVTNIVFSPKWATDKTVLVTTVSGTAPNYDVHLQCGSWGTSEGWNEDSTLGIEAVAIKEDVPLNINLMGSIAGITLPSDYNSKNPDDSRLLWVWVNYYDEDSGDPMCAIMRVDDDSAGPVGPMGQIEEGELWLTNISYHGTIAEGEAIAGVLGDGVGGFTECCKGVQVYRNDGIRNMDICCERWHDACKPPTGVAAMAVSYVGGDKAYAVALGGVLDYDEGAWSWSLDDGDNWNQLSLVDTDIDYLSDVAVSPDCNKTMLVSVNLNSGCACDSVWLNADTLPEAEEYSGQWLRTWCGKLEKDYGLLRLAPEETTGDTVLLVDRMSSNVYRNDLEGLACWDPIGSTELDEIVDLAAQDTDTLFALDDNGDIAMFDDDEWQEAVASEVGAGWTIAVHGDYILVGGQDGDVSYSDDGGEIFAALEGTPTAGFVTVAFDSYFDTNDTTYAAIFVDPTDGGVYRWVIDESEEWKDLNAEPSTFQLTGTGLTTDSHTVGFTGLVLDRPAPGNPMTGADTGGVLYASYVAQVGGNIVTGVARCLRPAADLCCEEATDWDYLIQGLTPDEEAFYMMPQALKICGCLTPDSNSKLFAIDGIYAGNGPGYDVFDGSDGTVWSFEDCYAKAAPAISSPADDALIPADPCWCINIEVILRWERQCDACSYDIQIALDEDFTERIIEDEDYMPPKAMDPTYVIGRGALNCDNTYYWRVRSADAETGQMIHSWWSVRSFRVAPGPGTGIVMITPEAGATEVPITDIAFTWDMTSSADNYDWVLSENSDLSAAVETKTGLTEARCTFTGTLEYSTPYYWTVTAFKDGNPVDQATSTFTTIAETEEAPTAELPPTPAWVWVIIAIGAVLVIVVIVLIFRTRRV